MVLKEREGQEKYESISKNSQSVCQFQLLRIIRSQWLKASLVCVVMFRKTEGEGAQVRMWGHPCYVMYPPELKYSGIPPYVISRVSVREQYITSAFHCTRLIQY